MTAPVPAGVQVEADADTVTVGAGTLLGGSPRRVMRLSAAGQAAWAELRDGPVTSIAAGVLARRLTDAGLAHPRPPATVGAPDVTVVVPVRDRAAMLDRCLAALGDAHLVVVVDDGSADAGAIAEVARHRRARLVRRDSSHGPAAARNLGLAAVTSELVAFLDSDCTAPTGWLASLAGHFDDPLVGAVAPRVVAASALAHTYLGSRSALDLGDRAALVRPGARVAFVPTAALVVRRSALQAVATESRVFDEGLRYGEDVDLVWRLDAAGWRVRYDPSVEVVHDEPASWRDRAARRFRYGTSAAPLARRHPGALAPLRVQVWPMAAVGGLLLRRPAVAAAALAAGVAATRRAADRAGVDVLSPARLTVSSLARTWVGAGRYTTQFGGPLVVGAVAARRGRLGLAALILGPPLWDAMTTSTTVSPWRRVAGQVADDVAYGAGVAAGAIRHRTLAPVLPVLVRSGRKPRGES